MPAVSVCFRCRGAVRRLNEAGLPVIVATNQSGVGRGYFPESLVHTVNRVMTQQLAEAGAKIDAIYYCPHTSAENLWLPQAKNRHAGAAQRGSTGSMCQRSFVVGDRNLVTWNWREMPAREVSSCALATAKVNSPGMRRSGDVQPDFVAEDLAQAAD